MDEFQNDPDERVDVAAAIEMEWSDVSFTLAEFVLKVISIAWFSVLL